MSLAKLKTTQAKYEKRLFALPNVTKIGIGLKKVQGEKTKELAIIVSVTKKLPLSLLKTEEIIPTKLDSIQTDVIEVGIIQTLPPSFEADHKHRIRPAKPGFSIGNQQITAGTFGAVVYKDFEPYILSNAHVLVSDPVDKNIGIEPILQPGPYDGGRFPEDHLGYLEKYIPVETWIDISTCRVSNRITKSLNYGANKFNRQSRFHVFALNENKNTVDAAIAKPLDPADLDPSIDQIGEPSGIFSIYERDLLGAPVIKSGRTTGVTKGNISQINVTANIIYGGDWYGLPSRMAYFMDQLVIESEAPFSQGGDSGSVIVLDGTGDVPLVGLLFAGNQEGTYTIANRIDLVLPQLGVHALPE
jgi:hypothetical protein